MSSKIVCLFLFCLVFVSCGGANSEVRNFAVESTYPLELVPYADNVQTKATLLNPEGAVVSVPASGVLNGNIWTFAVEPLGSIPSDCILRVEYEYDAEGMYNGVIVASYEFTLRDYGDSDFLRPNVAEFNLAVDDDDDTVNNMSEIILGLNPRLKDTDGDGMPDGVDAFPSNAAEWLDVDHDGVGDNAQNGAHLIDGEGPDDSNTTQETDLPDPDVDGDGIRNESDNCRESPNPKQEDVDGDGIGDACDSDADGDGYVNNLDNCPFVSNPTQVSTDTDRDGVPIECDMDDNDALVGPAHLAVFVDELHGSDLADGSRAAPVKTISKAIDLAGSGSLKIYVAAGRYDVSNVILRADTKLFGGFASGTRIGEAFAHRDVWSTDMSHVTTLFRNDVPTTIAINASGVIIDGFTIANEATSFDEIQGSSVVKIVSGNVTLTANRILGNHSSERSAGVWITGGNLSLFENSIDGGGVDGRGSLSRGIVVEGSHLDASHNVIVAGHGRFATGIVLRNSNSSIKNNTIDARSSNSSFGASQGVDIADSSPEFVRNIVAVGTAPDEYVIICSGGEPASHASFSDNIFARFPKNDEAAIVRNCDGTGSGGATFEMGDALVSSNGLFGGITFEGLLDYGAAAGVGEQGGM